MSFLRKITNRGKSVNDGTLPRSKTFPTDQNGNSSSRPPSIQQFLKERDSWESSQKTGNQPGLIKYSRLSQTLQDCLSDPSSVGYFLQYLDKRHLSYLVKFYLDVESYRCSATESSLHGQRSSTPAGEESGQTSLENTSAAWNNKSSLGSEVSQLEAGEADGSLGHREGKGWSPEQCKSDHNNVIKNNCDKSITKLEGDQHKVTAHGQGEVEGQPGVKSESSDSFDSGIIKSDADSMKDSVSVDYNTDSDSLHSFQLHQSDHSHLESLKAKTEDAVKIYRRYIAPDSDTPLSIPTDMKKEIVEEICAQYGLVSATCFNKAQMEVYRQLEADYYPEYLTSGFHTKHQIDVLTGGPVNMTDILYQDLALFNFMEFMESEGVRHILEFWIAANNFELSVNSAIECSSYSDVTHDAMILYDKYFSMQAKYPLGFGDDIRLEIENNICQDTGPQTHCFHRPLRIIVEYMEHKHLPKFLASKLFDNFVKELINSVQNGDGISLDRHRSTESLHSCTSDQSSRTNDQSTRSNQNKNTLLANADKLSTRLDKIQMDTTSLTDPDSIWRRDPVKGRIGEVDSFGRYHSYWEPAPDIKQEGGLLDKVKKLGGRGGQIKLKEEMAWQVAQMFIQDVVSITMDKENAPEEETDEEV